MTAVQKVHRKVELKDNIVLAPKKVETHACKESSEVHAKYIL